VGNFDEPIAQIKQKGVKFAELMGMNLQSKLTMAVPQANNMIGMLNQDGRNILGGMQSAISSAITNNAKSKLKIKYAKEFFITEKGEVI